LPRPDYQNQVVLKKASGSIRDQAHPALANLKLTGRPRRAAESDLVYHALIQANAKLVIFADEGDSASEQIPAQAVTGFNTWWLAYSLMRNPRRAFRLHEGTFLSPRRGL
jgi:hypothetical protein